MDNFYTYTPSSSELNTGVFEFDSVYSGNTTDVTQTSSGSGVHNYRDLTLNLRIQDRDGQEVTDARDFLKSAFLTEANISILEIDGTVAYANYQSGYKQSSYTFTEQSNIDIFGFYAPHFGIKTEIKDRDDNVTTSEFYFYGNRPRVSSITVTDTATGHKFTSSAGSASTQVLSGVSGQLKIDFDFLNSPEYTNFDHVDIYWASGSTYFDSNPLSADHLAATKTLSQNKDQSVFLFEENIPQFTGSDLYLTIKPYSTIGLGDQWTVGPFKFEYAEKPNTNYLTEISSGDVTGALGFTPISSSQEEQDLQNVLTQGNVATTGMTVSDILVNPGDLEVRAGDITLAGQGSFFNINSSAEGIRVVAGAGGQSLIRSLRTSESSTAVSAMVVETNKMMVQVSGAGDVNSAESNESNEIGSYASAILLGTRNKIFGDFDGIVAGTRNVISGNADFNFIGAGSGLDILNSDYSSSIGGVNNDISGSDYAVIGGGKDNSIITSDYGFIGGGLDNTISGAAGAQVFGSYVSVVNQGAVYLSDNDNRTKQSDADDALFLDFSGGVFSKTGEFNIAGGDFSVDGSNGRLFGVTDEVTGTVFSVNDAAGLPIVEVESTSTYDKITMGEYGSDALVISGANSALFNVDVEMTGTLGVTGDITMGGETVLTGITSAEIVSALGYTPLSTETDDQTLQEILDATPSATGTINVDVFSGVSGVLDVIQATGDLTLKPLGSDGNGGKLILDGDSFNIALQIENNGQIRWGGGSTYNFGLGSTYWQWKSWAKPIHIVGGAGTVMYIGTPAGDGNVGIGTDSPSKRLTVASDGVGDGLQLETTSGNHYATLTNGNSETFPVGSLNMYWGPNNTFRAGANNNEGFVRGGSSSAGKLSLQCHTQTVATVRDGGIGIFYTDPNYELDVSGSGHFLNDLIVDEDITMGGNIVLTGITSGDITGALGYTPLSSETDDQTLDEVLAQGNTSSYGIHVNQISGTSLDITTDVTVTGDVEADEFIGDLRGAVSFRAKAGEALSAGDVVYISGIDGNTTVVAKADADDSNKMPAFGVSKETVNASANVRVINFGSIGSLDTSAYSEGEELFVSDVAGQLTGIAPTGEASALQKMAKVTRSHASSGSITVMGAGRSNAVPNLNEGRLFVGNSSNEAVADDTAYVDITNSRVGIGTTSPDNRLEVVGPYAATPLKVLRHGDYGNVIQIGRNGVSETANIGYPADSTINFSTAGSERVRINSSGNVGIGTTNPIAPLDVDGNIYSNGALLVDRILSRGGSTDLKLDARSGYGVNVRGSGNASIAYFDYDSGSVGIGTTAPCAKLEVNGHFAATSKSFIIDHPTQKDKKLQYASLEGPENGVYVRGTTDKETIDLPEYWSELVHEDSITVVLTPIGKKQDLFIIEKSNKLIKIGGAEGSFDYVVYGERKDIDKLEIEPLKV